MSGAFKQDVNDFLVPDVQDAALKEQMANGSIDPKKQLWLDLGISTTRMQALAGDFNDLIRKGGKVPIKRVTATDLSKCTTLDDLYKLLAPSFPS